MADEHDDDGYRGPATLTVDGHDIPVRVLLDARHEPLDGRLHWFGRLTLDEGQSLPTPAGSVELSTSGGRAAAKLGEVDPWGRYRVTGVGRLPYAQDDPDLDD